MHYRYKLLIGGIGLCALAFVWWMFQPDTAAPTPATPTTNVAYQFATSSVATIPVSGVVTAADTAVISAQTNGVVQAIAVAEGSAVRTGSLLVRQATPIADAQVQYQAAQASLTNAEQRAVVDAHTYTAKQAAAVAYSADTIAILQTEANQLRTQEQVAALRTSLESGVLTLLSALTFVQDNRTVFDDSRREQFTTIVNQLYGRLPKQFHTGVLYGASDSGDVLATLEELRRIDIAELSVVDTQTLAVVITGQLHAITDLYTTAERTVLDPDEVVTGGTIYTNYFTERTNVISARSAIESAAASLQTTVDSITQQSATNVQSVVVSELDKEMAERQATFVREIEAAAQAVAASAQAVAAAEQSLKNVTAPFAGVVAEVLVEAGEYAMTGTPLLRLVGDGARELTVTVPATVIDYVTVGAGLLVDGEMVGQVVRRSPVSNGSSYTVVVSLTETTYQTGMSLKGELTLTDSDEVRVLPRAYVYARGTETYVTTKSGEHYPVRVLSDNGDTLVVTLTTRVPITDFVPARSIRVQ